MISMKNKKNAFLEKIAADVKKTKIQQIAGQQI